MAGAVAEEPFPALDKERLGGGNDDFNTKQSEEPKQRRRRKSSSLPGEPRGDTGGVSFSTMSDQRATDVAPVTRTPSEKAAKPFAKGYKRRKAKTLLRRWKSTSLRHTWLNPLLITLGILGAYFVNPGEENPLHKLIFLSYPVPNTSPQQYGKGGDDFVFIAFYTIVLTFTREFTMQRILRPIAIHYGIKSRAKQSRFMEQAYTAIYFAIFGPYGLYVMKQSPVWYFETRGMFENFPHKTHVAEFKAYYLLQAAYWSQQAIVLVLLLEKPRKDFKELVGHHIITIALIWCSYRFHFTHMGLAVYITHDISDLFLATSKVLNYLDHPLTSPFFAVFIFVWGYLRHYLNLRLLYAVLTDFKTIGPWELNWETQQYKCWISQYITFALLAALQAVNLFWFFLILRIAKRIVFDSIIEDERSEDGDDDVEVEDSTDSKRKALGLPANGDSKAGIFSAQERDTSTPTVLLNGEAMDDTIETPPALRKTRSSGRQSSAESKGQEKRRKGR